MLPDPSIGKFYAAAANIKNLQITWDDFMELVPCKENEFFKDLPDN
jgi:hypothetical protein